MTAKTKVTKKPSKSGVKTKAARSYSGSFTSVNPHLPERIRLTNDPQRLMSLHKGYIYAANCKISSALSAMPFHLYGIVNETEKAKLRSYHGDVDRKSLKAIAKETRVNLGSKKTMVEIYEHPFLDLLKKPAPNWSQTEWFKVITEQLGMIGNAYVLKGLDASGQLVSLLPLDAEYMMVRFDSEGVITQYSYQPQSRKSQTYTPDQILHIRNRTAGSTIVGAGDAEACQHAFALAVGAYQYQIDSLNNFAIPPGMWVIEGANVRTEEDAIAMRLKFQEFYGGRNRGKAGLGCGQIKWIPTTSTMADAQIDKFMLEAKKEIAASFRVPLSCLDETNSNKSTALVAMQQLMRFGVFPKASLILDQINSEIVSKYYDSKLLLWIDQREVLDADPAEQATVLATHKNSGIMSVNECRAVLGLPLLDGSEFDTPIAANASVEIQSNTLSEGAPVAVDKVPDKEIPATELPADTTSVAATALNGAQIASIVTIIQQAASGQIPFDSVMPILSAAFPMVDRALLEKIVEPMRGFTPTNVNGEAKQ